LSSICAVYLNKIPHEALCYRRTATAGATGSDEERCRAWLCRADVWQGTPGRRVLTHGEWRIAAAPLVGKITKP